jgi:hypothetical protein
MPIGLEPDETGTSERLEKCTEDVVVTKALVEADLQLVNTTEPAEALLKELEDLAGRSERRRAGHNLSCGRSYARACASFR